MKKAGGGDLDNDTHPRKIDIAGPTLYMNRDEHNKQDDGDVGCDDSDGDR